MFSFLFVLEFSIAKGFFNSVPQRANSTTDFVYFDGWELPGEIDAIEVVVVEKTNDRVDEFISCFGCFGLSNMKNL